jgi:hypothetical protein
MRDFENVARWLLLEKKAALRLPLHPTATGKPL